MNTLADRARAAADILDAAAQDGIPAPRTVDVRDWQPAVTVHLDSHADVHRWAQWLGLPDAAMTVEELDDGRCHSIVAAEKYGQPIRVVAVERIEVDNPDEAETVEVPV